MAVVAQLVEHSVVVRVVAGSKPVDRPIFPCNILFFHQDSVMKNDPDLWLDYFPRYKADGHKYDRGHAVIYGAPKLTGATRLASSSCARLCGLTTVVAPFDDAASLYRTTLPAHIMVEELLSAPEKNLSDTRRAAVLAGSGGGYGDEFFRNLCFRLWEMEHVKGIVLDAEGFKAWRGGCVADFSAFVRRPTIVTPHEGEFHYVFGDHPWHEDILRGDRAEQAQKAARKLDAIVVLKGVKTVIADNTRVVVNEDAPPFLATAGSGDVLAGMITGLVAAGMEPFWAACAGVWLHARAAEFFGLGLVATDLPDKIPHVLQAVWAKLP